MSVVGSKKKRNKELPKTTEKINPFEIRKFRPKHPVLNRKIIGGELRLGQSRAAAQKKACGQ
jgi:hypothetical protein